MASSRSSKYAHHLLLLGLVVLVVLMQLGTASAYYGHYGRRPAMRRWNAMNPRSVWPQLSGMIHKTTGHNALAYSSYGCWCGKGGQGTPVDQADICCRAHDHCYDEMIRRKCNPYLVVYEWNFNNRKVQCSATGEPCADDTCECDRVIAECLANAPYNKEYFMKSTNTCI